ncbi:MAG: DUF3332 domain-containing protein [Bacteroidetes bacterium]|nr:DUF3332 domain-containing protein [Bacteroidota bacterium]
MKILKRSALVLMMGSIVVTQSGCFGSFNLTKKIYGFNESASDNKFVRSLLFWGMCIIPVYAVGVFLDTIIFNLIEFWSGSNPIAMNEGDHEMQLVTVKGERYKLEATKDTFTTTQLTGAKAGEVRIMKYDRGTRTWKYSDSAVQDVAVMTFLDDKAGQVRIYTADGSMDVAAADMAADPLVAAHLEGDALASK